jgi:hypothetical protein
MSYESKYIKYKNKYLKLKELLAGGEKIYTIDNGVLTINNNVREINATDIINETLIKKVIIPESVKYIGDNAFHNKGLEEIEFERKSRLMKIGKNAFSDNNLKWVHIPNNVYDIGENAFRHNYLEWIYIPNDVTKLYYDDFQMKYDDDDDYGEGEPNIIKWIHIPYKLEEINPDRDLEFINIMPTLYLGIIKDEFHKLNKRQTDNRQNLNNLNNNSEHIVVYDTGKDIDTILTNNGNDATFKSGTKYINKYNTVTTDNKPINILYIPNSVVYIDIDAFKNVKIKKLIFEKNSEIDYINQEAFANCDLEEVVFNDNINKNNYKRIINNTAFDGNKNITEQLKKYVNNNI